MNETITEVAESMYTAIRLFSLAFFLVAFFASCASQKAVIDRAAAGKILWPGPPEKPRISYLWSVSTISGGKDRGISEFFAGAETDLMNPETSSTLLRPYGLFLDESGKLFITDPGGFRITVVDQENAKAWNISKAGDESFRSPIGIVACQGKIFVSDSVLKKVFVLDRDGKKIGELPGEFARPTSLALDRSRNILYVSDTLAHTIVVYTVEGRKLRSIGTNGSGEGQLNFPTHIWVDLEGKLYVTDSMNFRIQVFSPEGAFQHMFGALGDAYGDLEKPKGVATDSDGNIYVVDSLQDTVKIFNASGELLLFFGQQGRDYGQFWLPSGIFIDPQDRIYIADTYNGRVQVFQYLKSKKE